MVALAAVGVLMVAFLVLQDRQARRLHELVNAHRLEVLGLVERSAAERSSLLQRIQAPEVAVAEHAGEVHAGTPPAVPTTDDDAFWEARGDVGEALERIAEMEREGL